MKLILIALVLLICNLLSYHTRRNYGYCIGTRPIVCPNLYRPVCGSFSSQFCKLRNFCKFEFSNPCEACRNFRVFYYVEGSC